MRHLCWCDRLSFVVVRGRRAATLSPFQFAIFIALYLQPDKTRITRDLVNEVYRGASDPPLNASACVLSAVGTINKKFKALKLHIKVTNRARRSTYRLERV